MRVSSRLGFSAHFLSVILLASGTNLQAQQLGQQDACYRFDRQYFNWVGRPPTSGQVFVDSGAAVRLASSKHSEIPNSYTLVPTLMVADSFTMNTWLRSSSWRFFAPDSIFVVCITVCMDLCFVLVFAVTRW